MMNITIDIVQSNTLPHFKSKFYENHHQSPACANASTDSIILFLFLFTTTLLLSPLLWRGAGACSAQSLQWAKAMGGTTNDAGYSIKVGGNGNIYTTGSFSSTADFNPGAGTFNLISAGFEDIFVAKYLPCSLTVSVTKTNILCEGQCTGIAAATAASGTTPYSYYWSCGDTTVSVTGKCAGNYFVTVSDSAGCAVIDSVALTEPALPLQVAVSTTPTTCGASLGAAAATASGGTSPYTYLWHNGKKTAALNNQPAGTLYVIVEDSNGCFSYADGFIENNNGPTVTLLNKTNVSCFGKSDGELNIYYAGGTGALKCEWSNGATTPAINNLTYGPYSVIVTDSAGCIGAEIYFVDKPSPLELSIESSLSSCNSPNGSATATVNGGVSPYSFIWSTGDTSNSLSAIFAGTYSITVYDANGCIKTALGAVSDSTGPAVVLDSVAKVSCGATGAVYANALDSTANINYSWSNGGNIQDLTGLASGFYGLKATDSLGCVTALTAIVQPALPELKPICLVSYDTAKNENIVVFTKPQSLYIKGFKVYRESAAMGTYQLIGFRPYDSLSVFHDTITDPEDRWARYKISMVDTCSNEGALSNEHKTIHLTIESADSNHVSLVWDEYQGYPLSYYRILRIKSVFGFSDTLDFLDSVPSTQTWYIDSTPPSPYGYYYLIELQHPAGCLATKASENHNTTRSNKTILMAPPAPPVQSAVFNLQSEIIIYPNPNDGEFVLDIGNLKDVVEIKVLNLFGETVVRTTAHKDPLYRISLPGSSAGVYFLQVVSGKEVVTKKIIVKEN